MVTATIYTIPVTQPDTPGTYQEGKMAEILAKLHAVLVGGATPEMVMGDKSPEMLLEEYEKILLYAPKSVLPQS